MRSTSRTPPSARTGARYVLAAFALCALALGAGMQRAAAELLVCNDTAHDTLRAAAGTAEGSGVATHGWVTIVRSSCATVIAGDLTATTYYVYAQGTGAGASPVLTGPVFLCVGSADHFLVEHADNLKACLSKGAKVLVTAQFVPLRAAGTRRLRLVAGDGTYTLDEKSASASLP